MKASVSAWCVQSKLFSKEISIYDFIDLCCEREIKYIELLDLFFESDSEVEKVRDYIRKYGMGISAYSVVNDFVQPEESARKEQIDSVKCGIDRACTLGTGIVRIFSGNFREGIGFEMERKWIVDGFIEVSKYAEENGIIVVLENHGLFAGKSSQIKSLIDEVASPNFKANTDTGNFILVNENPLEAIRALKDVIGFVHFKDFKEDTSNGVYDSLDGRRYNGVALGEGEVTLDAIVGFLHDNGYNGYLSIEYEGTGDPIEGTKHCIDYLKSIIV